MSDETGNLIKATRKVKTKKVIKTHLKAEKEKHRKTDNKYPQENQMSE